jgi:hypothetical protein
MKAVSAVLLSLAIANALSAQTPANNRLGFTGGFDTSYIDRLGGTTVVADLLNHFDDRDYVDWMLDPADVTGANFKFNGVRFILQDQQAGTAETYNVCAYNEDPAQPNFPNTTAGPFLRTGAFNYPAMPAGYTPTSAIAWILTVTFTSPSVPKGDKWIGLGLPQPTTGTWPTDGLSPHCTFDLNPTNTGTNSLDRVGPGIASMNSGNLSCYVVTAAGVPTGPATYPSGVTGLRRQMHIDIIANCTGGVPVTQTVQTRYPSSVAGTTNALVPAGGTTNMLSGLNPDVNDFNLSTPARADNIGFLITDANYPNSPVFVMTALFPNPIGSLPLTTLASGSVTTNSTGNVCIDFTSANVALSFTNASGVCQYMMPISPGARTLIGSFRPLDIWYQGFVFNPANPNGLELHGTGCAIQHL